MTGTVMTVTRLKGYPYELRLPTGRKLMRCFVVLAQHGDHAGLWGWQRPDENQLAFRGEVDWSLTPQVTADPTATVPVYLMDGTVVEVVKGGACSSCGPMARFAGPSWSNVVTVRT